MLIRIGIYWTLLIVVVALAWWRGDREVRIAALVCVLATIGSLHVFSPFSSGGLPFNAAVAIVDVLTFAAFTTIALRSDRFWPLWIAGLQLTATLSHVMRLIAPDLIQVAYDAAMKLWSYPLLLILGAAAWRHARDAVPAERSAPS